jgi:hypothetical protein
MHKDMVRHNLSINPCITYLLADVPLHSIPTASKQPSSEASDPRRLASTHDDENAFFTNVRGGMRGLSEERDGLSVYQVPKRLYCLYKPSGHRRVEERAAVLQELAGMQRSIQLTKNQWLSIVSVASLDVYSPGDLVFRVGDRVDRVSRL